MNVTNSNGSSQAIFPSKSDGGQTTPACLHRQVFLELEQLTELQSLQSQHFAHFSDKQSQSVIFLSAALSYLYRASDEDLISISVERRGSDLQIPVTITINRDDAETFSSLIGKISSSDEVVRLCALEPAPVGNDQEIIFSSYLLSHDGKPERIRLRISVLEIENPDGFQFRLEFGKDHFDDKRADYGTHHFKQLLNAIVHSPNSRIAAISIVSERERRGMLGFVPNSPDRSQHTSGLFQRFTEHVIGSGDQIAVYDGNERLSYAEMSGCVLGIRQQLAEFGVVSGDRVVVCVRRNNALVCSLFAALSCGATYVPVDPNNPRTRIEQIVSSSDAVAAIVDQATIEKLSGCGLGLLEIGSEALLSAASSGGEFPKVDVQHSNLIYTSGSTGQPKGVIVQQSGLINNLESMRKIVGFTEQDQMLAVTTAAFDASVFELCLPIWCGGRLRIVADEIRLDPSALAAVIDQEKASYMFATPATWQMLIDYGWQGSQGLKIICGGEAMSRGLADSLLRRADDVWNIYGPTETTICSTVKHVTPHSEQVSIGTPIENTCLRVMNSEMELVPVGVQGELYIGGSGVANGYVDQPELTRHHFVPDPYNPDQVLYRTGDKVKIGYDNELYYAGRVDHQIKLRGFRIEPGEIEAAMLRYAGVKRALVMMRGAHLAMNYLEAFIVADEGFDVNLLLEHTRALVPDYMVPTKVTCLPHFPLTVNGKVDRKALLAGDAEVTAERINLPQTDLEARVAQIWRERFSRDVDRTANFFDQGGNSVMAVGLLAELEERLGVAIRFGAFFEQPTIAGLAQIIEQGTNAPTMTVPVRLNVNNSKEPALFCISGVHLYQALAKALSISMPVYGVYVDEDQQLLTDLSRGKHVSMEQTAQIAKRYVQTIREYQPIGPYRLAGFSYGGMIAYEVARQLKELNCTVDCVVLLDTPLNRAMEREKGFLPMVRHSMRIARAKASLSFAKNLTADKVRILAADQYESSMQTYSGRVMLCSAIDESLVREERSAGLGWDKYVNQLAVEHCKGDHFGMISSLNAENVARRIELFLGIPSHVDSLTMPNLQLR